MERNCDRMDQAEGDLAHAKSDMEGGFYEWSCFSSQQTLEKAVKAVFQKMGAEAWGVVSLLMELSKRHRVPKRLTDGGLELDKAYIPARYLNEHPSGSPKSLYTQQEARRLIAHAKKVIKFCARLLPEM